MGLLRQRLAPNFDITETSELADDLALDSLDLLCVLQEVEDELGITIHPEPTLEQVRTVGDLINIIDNLANPVTA